MSEEEEEEEKREERKKKLVKYIFSLSLFVFFSFFLYHYTHTLDFDHIKLDFLASFSPQGISLPRPCIYVCTYTSGGNFLCQYHRYLIECVGLPGEGRAVDTFVSQDRKSRPAQRWSEALVFAYVCCSSIWQGIFIVSYPLGGSFPLNVSQKEKKKKKNTNT